jgi:hypothetical protein
MNTTENINSTSQPQNNVVKPLKFPSQPQEWKIVSLRECPTPQEMQLCETPTEAAAYWRTHITQHPYFNPECECLVVLILNTRRKIKGHYFVSIGTLDTILCQPREVFRLAIMASAAAIIIMHQHPSGESTPSEADIKVTRDLIRGGQLLKIDVVDAGSSRVGHRARRAHGWLEPKRGQTNVATGANRQIHQSALRGYFSGLDA